MEIREVTTELLSEFKRYLAEQESADGTIQKYERDLAAFASWSDGREITKELTTKWKEHLVESHYAPATINSMLAALNTFSKFMGWYDCTVKFLKIQRKLFRDRSRSSGGWSRPPKGRGVSAWLCCWRPWRRPEYVYLKSNISRWKRRNVGERRSR